MATASASLSIRARSFDLRRQPRRLQHQQRLPRPGQRRLHRRRSAASPTSRTRTTRRPPVSDSAAISAGIAAHPVALQVDHAERIVRRARHRPHQPPGPVADQPDIVAIQQHRPCAAGIAQERLGAARLQLHAPPAAGTA